MSGPQPAGAKKPSRSKFTHPLTLALVPAVASVIVGIFALFPRSDPPPPPPPPPPAGHEAGIAFRVDTDFEEYSGGWAMAFEGTLPSTKDFPKEPGYVEAYKWAKTRGGVDVEESHLRLLLQNNGADRVTIRSINAAVTSRMSPISDIYVMSPSAGTNDLVSLAFNLDDGDVVKAQPETLGSGTEADTSNVPFFSTQNVTLDPGESTDVKITTRTTNCHCLYKFQIVVVKPDITNTLDIGDANGRPFAITARAPHYQERIENGQLGCPHPGLFYTKDGGRMADCNRPA